MKRLLFVVPANGRLELSRICLEQLAKTCRSMRRELGLQASAIVVADDENLETAVRLGFGWVRRSNRWLGRKFNDGIELATNPAVNRAPADYVVPFGSDDWADWRLFGQLPEPRTFVGFQEMSFVEENGTRLSTHLLRYEGGAGIRIFRADTMAAVGYRPCSEDRRRGCDTSILVNLKRAGAIDAPVHVVTDGLSLIDWKSADAQINPYADIRARHTSYYEADPFETLAGRFPADSLAAMRRHYAVPRARAVLA